MLLTAQGGAMVFTNNGGQGMAITVDIEGSSNLRIQDGDTFLKKEVTCHGGSRGFCIMKLLQNNEGPSLACSFSAKHWNGGDKP